MNVSLHLVPSGPPVWMRSMATSVSAPRDIVAPNAMKFQGDLASPWGEWYLMGPSGRMTVTPASA